jgi:glycine C-acetyltransferase
MTHKTAFLDHLRGTLAEIDGEGLTKRERLITSAQGAHVMVDGRSLINLCANNYLGLADHPVLIAAATGAMHEQGYGMASVRFICGTQDLHRELEARLAEFLGMEDSILFAACFDANGGLFEPLFGAEDAVVSDALNHASIIDGIRLCKAKRYRYATSDMVDLEVQLVQARADGARHILIATDGVFSMDGTLANLPVITALANKYGALTMVDDCHATGFMGPKGAGMPAHFGVSVDILTGTLGKALGGALGGYVAGPQPVIDLLRARNCLKMRPIGARAWRMPGLRCYPGNTRLCLLCWGTRDWRKVWRQSFMILASTWPGFSFPWCQRGRRAFAPR